MYEPDHKQESRIIDEMGMSHLENNLTEGIANTLEQMQDVLTKVSARHPCQEKNLPNFEKLIGALLDEKSSQICKEIGITVSEDVVVGTFGIVSMDEKLGGKAVSINEDEAFKDGETVTGHEVVNTGEFTC